MKLQMTREQAEAIIGKIDGITLDPRDAQHQVLADVRDRLAKRLGQTAAVQKLTREELLGLLGLIDNTRIDNALIRATVDAARPKLQAMLGAYDRHMGDDDDEG